MIVARTALSAVMAGKDRIHPKYTLSAPKLAKCASLVSALIILNGMMKNAMMRGSV